MRFKSARLGLTLAISDVKLHYRRTTLGPLWVTFTLFAQVLVIGLVFSGLFGTGVLDYMVFLSSGLVLWTFLLSSISEGASSLSGAGSLIKQVALPPSVHVYRVVFKNVVVLFHNSLIVIPLLALSSHSPSWGILAAVLGATLLVANVLWISLLAGVIGARYRDVPSIMTALLTLSFYITPILWMPEQLASSPLEPIIGWNPLFHWLQVVRDPIIGNPVPVQSLAVSGATLLIGFPLAFFVLKKKSARIPYWV